MIFDQIYYWQKAKTRKEIEKVALPLEFYDKELWVAYGKPTGFGDSYETNLICSDGASFFIPRSWIELTDDFSTIIEKEKLNDWLESSNET